MKSLHNSNKTPPDMASTSLISGTYQAVRTMTSTGSSSGTNNNVLCIKSSVAITGLNKLKTQTTKPDIAELANIFCTLFNLLVSMDSTSS